MKNFIMKHSWQLGTLLAKEASKNELPDYSSIYTIEHILSQTLNAEWIQYLGNDANNINLPVIITLKVWKWNL